MSDPISAPIDPPPPNLPMSVALARALAEAADGLNIDDKPFYLVAPYAPVTDLFSGGFKVWGPFSSWEDVPASLRNEVEEGSSGFFGPFQVAPEAAGGYVVNRIDLYFQEMALAFTLNENPDALFFTSAAVEKFALAYYERIFGPDFARTVKEQFAFSDVQVMAHYPWSEYSDGSRMPAVPHLLRLDGSGGASLIPLDPSGGAIPRTVASRDT